MTNDQHADAGGQQAEGADDILRPRPTGPEWNLKMYRDLARRSSKRLTHGEYRVLDALLTRATWKDPRQSGSGSFMPGGNCFPGRRRLAAAVGLEVANLDNFLRSLERKGWIRRIPFVRVANGQRTTDLIQFRIPHDLDDEVWAGADGPIDWCKRKNTARPAPRGHKFWEGRQWPIGPRGSVRKSWTT